MKNLTSLGMARALVILGCFLTLGSTAETFRHTGRPEFMFRGTVGIESGTHAWHHLFREATHDVGAMIALLFLMFAGPHYRNKWMWWGMLLAAIGLYAGYWIGDPINMAFAAPPLAEPFHAAQAILVLTGLLVARRYYARPTA